MYLQAPSSLVFFNLKAEESQFMLDLYAIYPTSLNQTAYDYFTH